jgi:prepilin-type processing-associated H-X9-DG protein
MLLVPGALACDAGDPRLAVDSTRTLCDGSDGLRLAVRFMGGLLPPPPANLFYEPGADYLFVDGHCRYWTIDPERLESPTHTGILDEAAAARVAALTHFQSWPYLLGPYTCTQGPPPDAGYFTVSDGTLHPVCPPCPSDAPPETDEMCSASFTLAEELFRGGPMDGPVRLYVQEVPLAGEREADWPLARDLGEVVAATQEAPLTIEDLADAAALRAMKAFSDQEHPERGYVAVRGTDGGHYRVHLRDVLPFEDAEGHVVF